MTTITLQSPSFSDGTKEEPKVMVVASVDSSLAAKEPEWLENKRKPRMKHHISNVNKEHWNDLFRMSHAVLPKVFLPSVGQAIWSTLVCIFYYVPQVNFLKNLGLPNSTLLITLLGTAMGLLLVFRVNNSYDRYWEGRKVWSIVHFQLRNLGRFVWIYCTPKTDEDAKQQVGAMHLLIAFASSVKHALRREPSHRYEDLGPHLQHIPDFGRNVYASQAPLPIPLEITLHLQKYLNQYSACLGPATACLNGLADALTIFQRIRSTPIPAAYAIHLKQTLFVYLLSLPFQLVASPLGWWTIPVTFLSCIVMLGIEVIGTEIENPFGLDPNDLPMDEYCDHIEREIMQIMSLEDPERDSKHWIPPFSLSVPHVNVKELRGATGEAVKVAKAREGKFIHRTSALLLHTKDMVARISGADELHHSK
ncbi:UPF0187-domain-containing protein [Rhizoclosmatium globosum]|uniref:UPF0187-domain-containing protein n=1 Tax=Rhizoclosmatium globosum TaxID=329046 RepID=A0A1Y2CIS4_9FUNG|nr:UPF0187-domain-containing protein [Rhizoclosmatium globosum]|eukprot:ORY46922.1 UPF0187-domain-containing protein [Rhizoclosmatium globosum]